MSQKKWRPITEITEAFVGLKLEVRKIDPEMLREPSRLEEVVEQKMKGVQEIQEGITDALNWLASVVAWLLECIDPMKKRIAKAEVAPQQEQVRKYVQECLESEEPIYRTAAAISYLNFQFGQPIATKED